MKTKVKGKALAILMSLTMVFTMMPLMSQTAHAADPTLYTIKVSSGKDTSGNDTYYYVYNKTADILTYTAVTKGNYNLSSGCIFRRTEGSELEYKFPSKHPDESSKQKLDGWNDGIRDWAWEPGQELELSRLFYATTSNSVTLTPVFKDISCGDNLDWKLYTEKGINYLSITGSGAMHDFTDPSYGNSERPAPWYDNISISDNQSYSLKFDYTNEQEETIYGQPTHIGDYAFAYMSIGNSSLALPSTVSSIGKHAFRSTKSISTITIPSSVEIIDEAAFMFSDISQVNFGEGSNLKTIGKDAFYGCDNLTKITIPDGVETIGERAIYNSGSLKEISIPESVTSIGNDVFAHCDKLETIYYDGSRSQWNALIDGVNLGISSGVEVICKKEPLAFDNIVLGYYLNTKDAKTIHMAGNTWRVIGYNGRGVASNKNAVTLISKDNIDNLKFNESANNHYSVSNLKAGVDGVAGSFSAAEKTAIIPRTLEGGSGNLGTGTYDSNKIAGGSVENALLWPLSVAEANDMDEELRKASGAWWLRSPGGSDSRAAIVNVNGRLGYTNVGGNGLAMRPAFNLNLESVLFTSAAVGGKSSGTVGAASLKKVSNTTSSEVKLTLFDKDRKFAVSRNTASGRPGDTLSFNYTNATVNDPVDAPSEYISAMIVDSEGYPIYYGRLAKPDSPSGKVNVKIPSGLANGTYTPIFDNQKIQKTGKRFH